MSWIEKLYETYENCAAAAINVSDEHASLIPVAHTTQNAQIEVVLGNEGIFLRARVLSKQESKTLIPCTEESGGRTSSPRPHPLHDKLLYLDSHYREYGGDLPKSIQKEPRKPYEDYITQLKAWCESPFGHDVARAVLRFVQRDDLIHTLIQAGILFVDDNGKLLDKFPGEKNQAPPIFTGNIPQADSFIRFRVEIPFVTGEPPWRDASLMRSWEQYYLSTKTNKALCYVSGQTVAQSEQHPAKLRNAGDKAKLISTNDASGFSYLGRFTDETQVMQLGYEVSHKAHSALRWLIEKQGYRNDTQSIVAWSVQGTEVPDPMRDTYDLFNLPSDIQATFTDEALALALKSTIQGYRKKMKLNDQVVVMGIDSATPGRMSISFYRELVGASFLDRLEAWHSTCSWIHRWKTEDETGSDGKRKRIYVTFVGAPAPKDIAYAAYGMRVDDKLKKATIERLLPCIVDGRPLPKDIVCSVVDRAKRRVSFETDWEWNKVLSIACALYRKYNEKERYEMALDETRNTRDYLYGRLLAIADKMEERALYHAGENRATNAARLMNRFADHPFTTWRILESALNPYRMRLEQKAGYYLSIIEGIMALFDVNDFVKDNALSGEYLLGYYCQREELRKKKTNETNLDDTVENKG